MTVHSAALLPYRLDGGAGTEVFLVRMAGPYWEGRHEGAWSIAKGLFDPAREAAEAAARREFAEEVGVAWEDVAAPDLATGAPGLRALGEVVLRSGKVVHVFAGHARHDLAFVGSNLFEMEWPRGSGRLEWFPEVDDGRWLTITEARRIISAGQRPALGLLEAALAAATTGKA